MSAEIQTIAGVSVFVCTEADDSALIASEQDAIDLIGNAYYNGAEWVALPVSKLAEDFFHLKSKLAGDITQKFVNYHMRLAVLGDISQYTGASQALKDFVYESNRGKHLWFLEDLSALETRLAGK